MKSTPAVVHIDTGLGWRGGQRQVLLLAAEQRRQGWYPLLVVQPGSRLEHEALAAGLEVIPVRMRGELDVLAVCRLRRILRNRLPQVAHAHTGHAHTLMLLAAVGLKVAMVVHRRVDFPPIQWFGSWIKYCWFRVTFICISQHILNILQQSGIPQQRLVHISSVVPPVSSAWNPTQVEEKSRVILGVIGALVPHKGHVDLLLAFSSLRQAWPGLELEILGEGPERDRLEQRVVELGLEGCVRMQGEVTDPWGAATRWRCLVVPSRQEGLSTTILDAMWFGIPIVATAAGGIPELLDEACAFIAEPSDVDSLGKALERMLGNPQLAVDRVLEARRRVSSRPDVVTTTAQVLSVYQKCLAHRDEPEPK